MLYLLAPELTAVEDTAAAGAFLVGASDALSYAGVVDVASVAHLASHDPGPADGVVLFNPPSGSTLDSSVKAFLDRAVAGGAILLPVAITESSRHPPEPAAEDQSFDVVDHLRRRSLTGSEIGISGEAFAREAISKIQPTCSRERLRLFICHRRADGEPLAAWLDGALSARHEHVFRDLVSIQTGDVAQEAIDGALEAADGLIFLDTPLAGDSDWVRHELETALGRRIPIVWIRVGADAERTSLPVEPAGAPHFEVGESDLSGDASSLADEVVAEAFKQSRSQVARAMNAFRDIRSLTEKGGAVVNTLDQRQMIYEVRFPAEPVRYSRRPRVDLLQVYGRRPTYEDRDALLQWLEAEGWNPHQRECRPFDAVVLLDPTPGLSASMGDWMARDHSLAYLESIAGRPEEAADPPALAILGAFPSMETGSHQEIIDAVGEIARAWLELGGVVVSGGHPTFTPVLVGAAAEVDPDNPAAHLVIYQSRYFANEDAAAWLAKRATLVWTEAAGDRLSSLSSMRRALAVHPGLKGAVCIGGRTAEGGEHIPGLDEEVSLFTEAGYPVQLLVAPGGRAAELAQAAESEGSWGQYAAGNDAVLLRGLSQSTSYRDVARRLWAFLGPPT